MEAEEGTVEKRIAQEDHLDPSSESFSPVSLNSRRVLELSLRLQGRLCSVPALSQEFHRAQFLLSLTGRSQTVLAFALV